MDVSLVFATVIASTMLRVQRAWRVENDFGPKSLDANWMQNGVAVLAHADTLETLIVTGCTLTGFNNLAVKSGATGQLLIHLDQTKTVASNLSTVGDVVIA